MVLDSFQNSTARRLRVLLAETNRQAFFENVILPKTCLSDAEGARKISADPYIFWIYVDGANVIGPKLDKRFEWQDYKNLDTLQEDFLRFVQRLLGSTH